MPPFARYNALNTASGKKQYHIVKILIYESAFIFIACDQKDMKQRVALKVLREYKDKRYSYATTEERLTCQREALRKNRMITPDIYQGLGLIVGLTLDGIEEKVHSKGELQSITLGEIVGDDDQFEYQDKQNCEYALIMSYLPEKQRLDLLLRKTSDEELKELLDLLVARVHQMHHNLPPPATSADKYGNIWGSNKQLQKKLEHNLEHFDFIQRPECIPYEQYSQLKNDWQDFMKKPELQEAFGQRRREYVKQCHGDLKARNIWIETINQSDNPLKYVSILDAVDFNESYRNIDILADLAMLVVDIEANRTVYSEQEQNKSFFDPASYVIKKYFSLKNNEQDRSETLVLAYYLLEKAIVCAIMCLVYDSDERSLGEIFLEIAEKHAGILSKLLESFHKDDSP